MRVFMRYCPTPADWERQNYVTAITLPPISLISVLSIFSHQFFPDSARLRWTGQP